MNIIALDTELLNFSKERLSLPANSPAFPFPASVYCSCLDTNCTKLQARRGTFPGSMMHMYGCASAYVWVWYVCVREHKTLWIKYNVPRASIRDVAFLNKTNRKAYMRAKGEGLPPVPKAAYQFWLSSAIETVSCMISEANRSRHGHALRD